MATKNPLFAFHKLNDSGQKRAAAIGDSFDELFRMLEPLGALNGREGLIVKTKLEEACFFAKKAVAVLPENQAEAS